ncbi:MAG: hypothetical protein H8E17_12995 [Deltaproteobacteria bacterium]|nr:hypothetical protein [Deltaproteobacteria bacterium]
MKKTFKIATLILIIMFMMPIAVMASDDQKNAYYEDLRFSNQYGYYRIVKTGVPSMKYNGKVYQGAIPVWLEGQPKQVNKTKAKKIKQEDIYGYYRFPQKGNFSVQIRW